MISLRNVSKKYGEHMAVDNVSIEIAEGEIFGLLGPNGAGKTTIVTMLSTILKPTKGEIFIVDTNICKDVKKVKTLMGIVPQELALYETLSAIDNLKFFGSLYGLSGKELESRAKEVLALIGLTDRADQQISKYSGGMKRRVNIGIALMHEPKILILDEPTVGIDPQSRNHILQTIKDLNKENITIIYTSHYMEEVEFLCDRIGILDYGKLIALGTKQELKTSIDACDILKISFDEIADDGLDLISKINGVEKVIVKDKGSVELFINSSEIYTISNVLDEIRKLPLVISGFSYEGVNLETIFLQLTGKSLRD